MTRNSLLGIMRTFFNKILTEKIRRKIDGDFYSIAQTMTFLPLLLPIYNRLSTIDISESIPT